MRQPKRKPTAPAPKLKKAEIDERILSGLDVLISRARNKNVREALERMKSRRAAKVSR